MNKILIMLSICLTACTNLQPKFEQSEIDSGELSFIKTKKIGFFSGKFFPWIHSVYDIDGNKIVQMAAYADRMNKLYLRPGEYLLVLLCDSGNAYGHPSIAVNLEPGKTYETSCEIVKPGADDTDAEQAASLVAKFEQI
ncbi:hypothetical protein QWY82_02440 [Simiduia curdlanivorans]|uniref:DUF2846 domain-containing protein n=1 Tax=Simiduia curdlanivorans TaxID=1492769 RepID=A0ABV8V389_9GAMM|nr:hypothetical protein [Simiduia curdlanivorans]MDN3637657.1 hypothetical protein [Simiduia curdlanivorans]